MKYIFTGETKVVDGATVKRIKRLSDGLIGGWIEKEENLSHDGDCFVYDEAVVSGNATVFGNAQVSGNATVFGNAQVSGCAMVFGNAKVYDYSWVYGNAWVYGDARVFGKDIVTKKSYFYRWLAAAQYYRNRQSY